MSPSETQRFRRLAERFEEARRAEPADRETLIRRVREEDPELAADLAALLEAHGSGSGPFGVPAPERDAPRPGPGDLLGPWRIGERLGEGGMGTVFLASAPDRPRVALKILRPDLSSGEERSRREAHLGLAVRHPNVVATLERGTAEYEGRPHEYLVMEYVEGQTLRELLAELGRLPEGLCRHIGREVARGLTAVHAAGVVHRDVKPENVLITHDHVVKIMDLGVALEPTRTEDRRSFEGTPHSAAPEQLDPEGAVDFRTDLHALGLLLHELATGRNPFRADTLGQTIARVRERVPPLIGETDPHLSPFLEELTRQLLEKRPEDRPTTAAEVLAILESGEAGEWWRARQADLPRDDLRPLRWLRVHRESALVGREEEVGEIRRRLVEALAGDGHALLVQGAAGVGKSRLVVEGLAAAHRDGVDFDLLAGVHHPGAGAAGDALAAALVRRLQGRDREAELARLLGDSPALVPAFAAHLDGAPVPEGAVRLDAEGLETAYLRILRGLAGERPVVLLIEDLHLASPAGLARFAALARGIAGHPVLVLGTARPSLSPEWTEELLRRGPVSLLRLDRLEPADVVRLLAGALGSDRLAEGIGPAIARKSDGNPFFALEILGALQADGRLRRDDGRTWAFRTGIDAVMVPESVRDLIAAGLADLSPEERELLDVACCVGHSFDASTVAVALARPPVRVLGDLGRIERRHRLVRSAGDHFRFDHHQVHEALYRELSETRRRQLHAAIGLALDARSRESLSGAVAARACGHLLRGGRGALALRHLEPALADLEARSLHFAAAELAALALSHPGLVSGANRVALLLRRADYLRADGHEEDLMATLADAREEARRIGDEAEEDRVRLRIAHRLVRRGRHADARREYEALLASARAREDRSTECTTLCALGSAVSASGDLDKGLRLAKESESIARQLGDRALQAQAVHTLADCRGRMGRWSEAEREAERALALFSELRDRERCAKTSMQLASFLQRQGRIDEAEQRARFAVEVAQEMGSRRLEISTRSRLASVFQHRLEFAATREELERVVTLCSELGEEMLGARSACWLAEAEAALGKKDAALRRLRKSVEVISRSGDLLMRYQTLHMLGGALHRLGRYAESRDAVRQQLEVARELQLPEFLARAHWELAAEEYSLGDLDAARACYEEALAVSEASDVPLGRAMAETGFAVLAGEAGRHEEALERYERAVARYRELGALGILSSVHASASETCLKLGDRPGARRHAEAHVKLLEKSGSDELILGSELVFASALEEDDPGRDCRIAAARERYESCRTRLRAENHMHCALLLWRLTGERPYLAAARASLEEVLSCNPAEAREAMIRNVNLFRSVAAESGD